MHNFYLLTTLYYILASLWNFKITIFVNKADLLFFTPLHLSFLQSLKFTLCDPLELWIFLGTVYFALVRLPYNLHYIMVTLCNLKVTIFRNITVFHIFTPISFIICLKFTPSEAIHVHKFFRRLYFAYLLLSYNFYYILVTLWHFKVTIFLVLAVFLKFIALAMHKTGHFSDFWLIKMQLMTNIPWNGHFTSFSTITSEKCLYHGFLSP